MWTVADHATRQLVTAEPTATAQQCAHVFETQGVRHLPVLDEAGRPVGLVSDSRVLGLMRRDVWDVRVSELALEPPLVVNEGTPLEQVLSRMVEGKVDAALVVDDAGVLVGIFTEHDALTLAANVIPPWMEVQYAVSPGTDLYGVELGTSADEARSTMLRHRVRHLIARTANGGLAGVVSLRDLAGRDLALVDQRLHAPVITVGEGEDLHTAVLRMIEHRVGLLPVMGKDGVRAVLTRTDIVQALRRHLHEIARRGVPDATVPAP